MGEKSTLNYLLLANSLLTSMAKKREGDSKSPLRSQDRSLIIKCLPFQVDQHRALEKPLTDWVSTERYLLHANSGFSNVRLKNSDSEQTASLHQ